MFRAYAPTTEDIDDCRFAASGRLTDLLRGEIDLDGLFGDDEPLDDDAGCDFEGSPLGADASARR
jgi:hypothetical protein